MSFTEVMDRTGQAALGEKYESRPEQHGLGDAITKSQHDDVTLMASAPTGTGKSLAGLIPSIEWARETGLPVVVATATKALQDQYTQTDLPLLVEHSGIPFKWAAIKGRGNYVCRAKLQPLSGQYPALVEELENPDHTGDFDSIVTPMGPGDRGQLTTSSEECPGKNDCPFGDVCFAQQAKDRAQEADIVIVNHSVLVIDLVMRESSAALLPDYGRIVIDEAHNLEDYATSALGREISARAVKDFADQSHSLLTDALGKDSGKLTYATDLVRAGDTLFDAITLKLRQAKENSLRMDDTMLLEFEDALVGVVQAAYKVREAVKFIDTEFARDDTISRRKRLLKRGASLIANFMSLMPPEDQQDEEELFDDEAERAEEKRDPRPKVEPIRWLAREERTYRGQTTERVTLNHAPLEVGPLLRNILWSRRSAVLMSATLEVNGDFSYVAGRLGLDSYRSYQADSPFDFDTQSAIYVPQGLDPSKDRNNWATQLNMQLLEMTKAAQGRAMYLFTSRKSMRDTHATLAPMLESAGFTVLMQGEGMPNPAIVAEKKARPEVVVFALKSFMEGVNIPGENLQLVVIDKLPFPSPGDIIFAARSDAVNRRYNDSWASFKKLSVPMMSLVLQQAVGRLIRTKTDRGLVAVMDGRMHPQSGGCSKPYGRIVHASVNGGRQISSMHDATDYLRGLRST